VPDDLRVLRGLGLADWHLLRIITLGNLGTAELWIGDHVEAEKHLCTAIETERWGRTLLPHINAKAHLALVHYERGDLGTTEADALAVVDEATGLGWSRVPQIAPAHLALAGVHLDRGDLAEADKCLQRVADIGDVAWEPHVQLAGAGLLALRFAGGGDLERALVGVREALRRSEDHAIQPRLHDRLLLLVAELCCRRRDRRAAVAALAALHEPSSPEAVLGAVRLHLLEGDPQRAERVLAGIAARCRTVRLQLVAGLLGALAADALDNIDLALDRIEDALVSAAPQRFRRPFLDIGSDLEPLLDARVERGSEVAAFAVDLAYRAHGHAPQPTAVLVEPLTTREQVVLRYLVSALSNAEIAAELYVSVNTVKTHQRAVYRKLAAEGRRDAVRRARELRLL
jgi:LuxR family maltose regulon positive regulatory protein